MSTRVETYVGGNCRYATGSWANCSGNQDARHIYSKLSDLVSVGVNQPAPVDRASRRGLRHLVRERDPRARRRPAPPRAVRRRPSTANYPSRDNSVTASVDLTPNSSYFCRVGPGASTTLTARSTASQTTITVSSATGFPTTAFLIRVDDEYMSVTAGFGTTTWTVSRGANDSAAAAHVSGQTRRVVDAPSGRDRLERDDEDVDDERDDLHRRQRQDLERRRSTPTTATARSTSRARSVTTGSHVRVDLERSTAISPSWNPDIDMLMIVANGNGGQVSPGDSIEVDNNWSSCQGGLYGTNAVEFGNNVNVDGPHRRQPDRALEQPDDERLPEHHGRPGRHAVERGGLRAAEPAPTGKASPS